MHPSFRRITLPKYGLHKEKKKLEEEEGDERVRSYKCEERVLALFMGVWKGVVMDSLKYRYARPSYALWDSHP
jgi:hypothetical protein